jgi:hypothetical protein
MSLLANQTNVNSATSFYSLAGSGGGGGVDIITAGSNVSVSGTSNVTINAVGTVASIIPGSNITVSGTSNVTINSTGAGVSGANTPILSSTPGTPVELTVPDGTLTLFYNVASDLLPQDPVTPTRAYRFTFNCYFTASPGAVTDVGGGIVQVICGLYTPATQYVEYICSSSCFASSTVPITSGTYSMSGIFKPTLADTIRIYVINNTGAQIEQLTLVPRNKGCGIELVSSASTTELIFS